MLRPLSLAACACAVVSFCANSWASTITPMGMQLASTLDSMDVEHRWPAGIHVDWESGLPDGRSARTPGQHTHCSAFVAATAKRLGVYILRPPAHSPMLLANAQYDWLSSDKAQSNGWHRLDNAWQAQALANQGALVVASYRNHHDNRPGHIAIVRPNDKPDAAIERDGPQITQAGATNFRSTSLQSGFSAHHAAWVGHEVRFYAHGLDAHFAAHPAAH